MGQGVRKLVKERFRNWNFHKDLRITYTDVSGNKQLWQFNQAILLKKIIGQLEQYQEQHITVTDRQLYYQLVAVDNIPNSKETYNRICKFVTDAKYAGFIDWDAIEDRGRVPEKHSEWESIKDIIHTACCSYRLPRWRDQEFYVELYCEKQALESVLKPVADKYHIYFGCNKGYSSSSTVYDVAKRLKEQIENGKKAIVLYLGDHDPSGLDMVRDIRDRIEEFLTKGKHYTAPNVEVIHLALNMQQIEVYKLPPNPTKIRDPRAAWYISQFGNISWELDALRPDVLIRTTEQGIQKYLDEDKYHAIIELEDKQKKELEDFGDSLSLEGKQAED